MSSPETENDFDFYLRFVKPLVLNLSEPNDRVLAAAWVQKLRDDQAGTEELRTDYLKLLLFVLQRKQLIGVFSENPNQYETLEKFPDTNLHDVARELLEAEEDVRRQQNLGGAGGDFPPYSTEHSADLLEYSAAQDIPNFGVHAYYAISNEPLPKWERTEKAVFPRGAASTTDRSIRCEVISKTSSVSSEPTVNDTDITSKDKSNRKSKSRNKSKSKSKSKKDKTTSDDEEKPEEKPERKGRSRIYEAGKTSPKRKSFGSASPSPLLGSKDAEEKERKMPTWGSNLIGVSELPVRDIPTETLPDSSEQESISTDSTFYPSLPYKTPSPRKPDRGEPCIPCSSPKSQRSPYSPLLPEGEADPFFLASPPSFLGDTSLSHISPVKASFPARRSRSPEQVVTTKVGEREYDLNRLKDMGLDESALGSDVFKLDNLEDFDDKDEVEANRSLGDEAIPRRSIDDDLDAFDRMLEEYEKDDYVAPPEKIPSPVRSTVPSAEPKPLKKVVKKKKVTKRVQTVLSRTELQETQPKTIKRVTTKTTTTSLPGPSAPETYRPSGSSRIPASGSSRIPASGGSRIPGSSASRIPPLGASRIPAARSSQMPRSISRIPAPGKARHPRPSVTKSTASATAPPYSPLLPEGGDEEEPFFLESPPSFLDESTLPSLKSYEEYPSWPIRTPSPKRPCPGSPAEQLYDLEELQQLGLEPADLRDIEGVDNLSISEVSVSSVIEHEYAPEFDVDDTDINRHMEKMDAWIAELYAENAEDMALYGSPKEKRSKSPSARSPKTSPALHSPKISPTRPPIKTLSVEAPQPTTVQKRSSGSSRIPAPGTSRIPPTGTSRIPAPRSSRIPQAGISRISSASSSRILVPGSSRIPAPGSSRIQVPSRIPPSGKTALKSTKMALPKDYSPLLPEGGEELDPFFLESPPSFLDESTLPSLKSYEEYPSWPIRTPSPKRPCPGSPAGPCPGSTAKSAEQLYDLDELKQLGLEPADLRDIEGVDNLNISEVSVSSEIEHEYAPEFDVDDTDINRHMEKMDAWIAQLYAENAEDIALYGSPEERPKSPTRRSPAEQLATEAASRSRSAKRSSSKSVSPKSSPMSPSFKQSVQEHDYTENFFDTDRPNAQNLVRVKNKILQLQRQSLPPSLNDIEEYEEATPPFIAPGSPAAQDIVDAVNKQHAQLAQRGFYSSPDRSPGWDFEEQERLAIGTSSPVTSTFIKSPPRVNVRESAMQAIDTASKASKQLAQIRTPPSRLSEKSLDSFEQQEIMLGANADAGAVAPIVIPPEFQNVQSARDAANKQYQQLELAQLEDAYNQRYQHQRPDMPRTPPVFSRYAAVMGEEQREYLPSEFGEIDGGEWQSGEQFFEEKQSFSPRAGKQESNVKSFFFTHESEPELTDIEEEFESSTTKERSPAATTEDVYKMIDETKTGLATKRETTPAEGGIPVTTPRPSPSPRRPNRSIRVETEQGEISFEMPSFDEPSPNRQDRLYFESPPQEYYKSPGSSPAQADMLPDPYDLPKPARFSPLKPTDFFEFHAKRNMIRAKAQEELRESESPPQHYSPKTTYPPQISPRQRSVSPQRRSPTPQEGDLLENSPSILDKSITEGLPSPIRPPIVIPGWTTPPHLNVPKKPPRSQLLPGPAENVRVRPGLRNIVAQEMPPEDILYSPPQLSPGDLRPSPKPREPSPRVSSPHAVSRRAASPRAATPRAASPRAAPPAAASPRAASPRAASPCAPCGSPPIFDFAGEDNIFDEAPPEEMFQSPRTPPRTPPRSARSPVAPSSPVESPFYLRMRLLQGGEPPYYSLEEMEIPQGRSVIRRQIVKRRSDPPGFHGLREVGDDYPEEHVPFLSQVESRAKPFTKQRKRIRVASPDMETVHESPIKVPEFTNEDRIAALRRMVQEIEDKYAGSPQAPVPPPEDLLGFAAPVSTEWLASPGILDRSFAEDLPPPIKPPTVVPGWTTPPRLTVPKRPPRPQLLPGPAETIIRFKPNQRDIVAQEMPPPDMIYSPPQLSPGDYPQKRSPKSQPSPHTPSPHAASPRAASPCAPCGSPLIFDFAEADNLFEDEAPPEDLFQSPRTPPRTPSRTQQSPAPPASPVESPFALRMRLLQGGEPPYYSLEEMEIPQGRSIIRRQVVKRRSDPPGLHGLREVGDDYPEEHVPFLSQVESRAKPFTKQRKRIKVASPDMETVHESPIKVPEYTNEDRIAALERMVQEIERRHPASPTRRLPEDLMGAEGPVDWQASPGILDKSFAEDLPSPIRPPTVIHGWTTPPGLRVPKRPPRPQLLPGPAETIVKFRPNQRDILAQEMPPLDMIYSPPQLSPGDYPQRRPPKSQPSPLAASLRAQSPCAPRTSPTIFDAAPIDLFEDETPPEELFQSPPRTPQRSPAAPSSPVESPFALRMRLLQGGEPAYYSLEEMEIPQGRSIIRRQVLKRRSDPPGLHALREVGDDYQEEHVPFLAQVEGAKPFSKQTRRIRVTSPGMETVHESPLRVHEFTTADLIAELEQRHPASPGTLKPPEDLMGAEGPVDWQASPGMLDRSIPGGLPAPMKPPTVIHGWVTPPHLKKQPKQPPPFEFKLIPGLRDILFQEMPPSDLLYSPPGESPKSANIPAEPRTSPQVLPRTLEDLFQLEPQFIAAEMPPDEFMPAGSPIDLENSMRYVVQPYTPDDTVDTFEEHEKFAARSPIKNVPVPSSPRRPVISPTQQLRNMISDIAQQYGQLDEPEAAAPHYGSPEQVLSPQLPQAAIDKQYADIYDTSLEDFEAIEQAILSQFPEEPKARIPPPPRAVFDQMIQTGGKVNRQITEMQRSPTWLERVEQKVWDVADPHLPRRRPYSPQYGQISPNWSPKLPKIHQYADQIEEEFMPEEVWGYESPKSPQPSPVRPTVASQSPERPTAATPPVAQSTIFDVEATEIDFLDQILPPEMPRSPTTLPTPPRIDDYYVPHTPTSPGTPDQFVESVKSHEFTDRYHDKNRRLMTDTIRVKNRLVSVSRPKRPRVSPIKEAFGEGSPIRPSYVPEGELVPVEQFVQRTPRERIEYDPYRPSLVDRAVPQVGLPIGMADPGLSFLSPPRTPRRTVPSRSAYITSLQYKDGLTSQSPPEFYASPEQERDIFNEVAESGIMESSPPGGYDFSPPPLSPQENAYSRYKRLTSPSATPSPTSPYLSYSSGPAETPISPSFNRSVSEHEYTDKFFDSDRPKAQNIVRVKNRTLQLQRQSLPPSLDDIEEYDEEGVPYGGFSSPTNYQLPPPVYYGSPGRQFIRTPKRRTDDPWEEQQHDDPVPKRIPFVGQVCPGPQLCGTNFTPDLDESFVEDDMADFKWMG